MQDVLVTGKPCFKITESCEPAMLFRIDPTQHRVIFRIRMIGITVHRIHVVVQILVRIVCVRTIPIGFFNSKY